MDQAKKESGIGTLKLGRIYIIDVVTCFSTFKFLDDLIHLPHGCKMNSEVRSIIKMKISYLITFEFSMC